MKDFLLLITVGNYSINPHEISHIFEDRQACIVYMKNGEKICSNMTKEAIVEKIRAVMKEVSQWIN